MTTFGETDWESTTKRADFLDIKKDGEYVFRVLSKPSQFAIHWVDRGGKKKKINCAATGCMLCKAEREGDSTVGKAQLSWMVPVLSRDTGVCQLLEFGAAVQKGIVTVVKGKFGGDPKTFDLYLDTKAARGTAKYSVQRTPTNVPFSEADKLAVKEFLETLDMDRFVSPSTNEQIAKRLEMDTGSGGSTAPGSNSGGNSKGAPALAETPDFEF
jgi:hypothetical protein